MIEKNPIKILFIEDIPEDVIVAEEVIRRENIEFISENVFTLSELESKLKEFVPDIVVCDYNLPGFTAIDVLSICKKYYPNIPFIVFTGSISEEVAVDCLQKGADDYILKKYIKKLPFAIKDAIRKKELEAFAKRERHLLETIVNNSPVGIVLIGKDEKIIFANDAYAKIFNVSKEEVKGKFCKEFISKIYNLEGKEIAYDECPIKEVFKEKKPFNFGEFYINYKKGRRKNLYNNQYSSYFR